MSSENVSLGLEPLFERVISIMSPKLAAVMVMPLSEDVLSVLERLVALVVADVSLEQVAVVVVSLSEVVPIAVPAAWPIA